MSQRTETPSGAPRGERALAGAPSRGSAGALRAFGAILWWDLLREMRRKDILLNMVLFA